MSRRAPNPAAERAAQNQATLKNLLKLEPNKVCADCKRNKHPRWASWNLGVFVCIRCSGIHRGMGTHISRVKSVDLDSWTEEQMKSILSWGNARANKYWEAKLAPGHVPSESKIENFIRTKYELKRWAMDGPIPDPSTLDADGDDNLPLSAVKEKQSINRSASAGTGSAGQSSARRPAAPPVVDLIGGVENTPPRASTTGPPATSASKVPPKADPAPPKSTPSNASLLGLDFLGESSAPPRPASTGASTPGAQSRPDLKQSILSLYASAPKPQPPQQTQHQQQQGSFSGMNSPPLGHQQQGSVGGFNDAFSNLSIGGGTTSPPPPAADPFASLGSHSSRGPPAQKPGSHSSFGSLGGGSFFSPKPAQPSPSLHQKKPSDGGFGDFGSFTSPAPAKRAQPTTTSHTGDLFDLAAPVSQTVTSPPPTTTPLPAASSSVFNLSSTQNNSTLQTSPPKDTATPAFGAAGIAGADVWGGGAWATPEPAAPAAPVAASNPPAASSSSLGWGATGGSFANTPIVPGSGGGFNVQPKVAADEEFGGWASSTGPSTSTAASKPPASGSGFGAVDEDLFSNVWQ
ncbi:hypothetical protein ACRE_016410 [Hapsidospora chrysogenum ATCC 11550]|uniref:Arf-GAP domain-containing protein n=1 Tax=Hapsidospora chrysogenum (strain ATCC 11550 / CBS 779.69 / DSM 880 / IAM 14645 / JCM 23072 / IMI 49137) TaxID=857340 RepID=A0A086TDS6_HAPC1|nr:hypothetical protein ACRE_016410 [Hapsidospora chrysogenum ATCC 11550]